MFEKNRQIEKEIRITQKKLEKEVIFCLCNLDTFRIHRFFTKLVKSKGYSICSKNWKISLSHARVSQR